MDPQTISNPLVKKATDRLLQQKEERIPIFQNNGPITECKNRMRCIKKCAHACTKVKKSFKLSKATVLGNMALDPPTKPSRRLTAGHHSH